MSVFVNSLTISPFNSTALSFDFQVIGVITISVLLILKLLAAAAANNSRFAYVLNLAINAPLVAFLIVFSVIAFIRIVLIINQ